MEWVLTIIGLLGVMFILLGYGLLAAGKLQANEVRYQWVNVLGTAGILLSLMTQWNLPAFVTNAAWITVGIISLARIYMKRDRNGTK